MKANFVKQLRNRAGMLQVDEVTSAMLEAAASIIETPDSIDDYAIWARSMWMSSSIEERDITIMSLGLPGETGEVVELLKKRVRDGVLDLKNLKKELGDVLYYWVMLCVTFGFKPSEVIEANQEKLNSRFERGTMAGSGDDR